MRLPKLNSWQSGTLVFLAAGLLFSLYFKGLMWEPNLHAPTFGGDGLTIHYNLQYHATYGEGVYLESQYYPHQESVFMTDAQALAAVVLAGLRPVFPHIGQYATGISNVLIFWSSPLAALLLFLIFRRLGVRWSLSFLFGCLIAMMSPQIIRQLGGQYTLGFTFLLPLVAWYQLAYDGGKKYWLKSILVALTVIIIGLNNPYLYAVASALLMGAAGMGILLKLTGLVRLPWNQLLQWIGVTLASTVVIALTLAAFDQVDDRVEVPFGFFHNIAAWGGMLTDQDTYSYSLIRGIIPGLDTPRRENQMYLGLIPILFALALPLILLVPKTRKAVGLAQAPTLLVLLAGTLPGLLLGFGLPFVYFEDWTYDHLGSLLQFRAPVRFSWPLFYVLAIGAGFALSQLYEYLAGTKKVWLLAIPLLLWSVDAHQFLAGHTKGKAGPSAFTPKSLQEKRALAEELGINTTAFSSIYLLPTEQGWSDKIHQDGSWRSNHDGYKLSLATGLPLLNGKLSRVGLSRVLRSLQVVSHPLIEKPALKELPAGKSILLLASNENVLDPREADLLATGEVLFSNEKVELRRVSPATLLARTSEAISLAKSDTAAFAKPAARAVFEKNTTHAFFGDGSRSVSPGWTTFELPVLQDSTTTNKLELSFWIFADKSRFGGPKFYLRQLGKDGKRLSEDKFWTNETFDAQNGWLRVAFHCSPGPETAELELVGQYEFPYFIDELWLREAGVNVGITGPDGQRMYNNFLLR
ncbi:MAG: hypothetical protein ACJATN_001124 [Neolewinella sp.]|jgi:hypothetical protein